jgi:hypothetical protein
VERPAPGQSDALVRLGDDAARPPRHLKRRAAGEGEEEDAFRGYALENQVRDAVREGIGLAGAGAGPTVVEPKLFEPFDGGHDRVHTFNRDV